MGPSTSCRCRYLSSCTAPPWRRHGSSAFAFRSHFPLCLPLRFCLTTEALTHAVSPFLVACCSPRVVRCVVLVACRGQGRFVKRWFVIKDSFLLCYNSREDMNNPQDGQKTGRRFVLPLMGMLLLLGAHLRVAMHACLALSAVRSRRASPT